MVSLEFKTNVGHANQRSTSIYMPTSTYRRFGFEIVAQSEQEVLFVAFTADKGASATHR